MNIHNPSDPEKMKLMSTDPELVELARQLFLKSCEYRYSYNFSWLGRPIIQYPEDIVAMQEIIWRIQPDLVVETGIAHGGSLIFLASMLELIGGNGEVLGIDIDIRTHNRTEIENHRLSKRITMIEGSSVSLEVAAAVRSFAANKSRVMLILDSNHTHEHVFQELCLYSPLVGSGSYIIVMDTVVEDMQPDAFQDRPWGRGDNPKTAVREFLKTTDRFITDNGVENKLLLSVAPEGYLRCVKD